MRGLFLVFLVIFVGYVYAQNNTKHPHNVDDKMRNNAASRLINMTYELIVEAKLLQRQMQPLQKFYTGQITYEIGYVMGKIRERYKRMIEIYKQAHYMTKHLYLDDKNISQLNTTFALKTGIKMYYPINWIISMEFIRLLEVDIDKLVEVLEKIPYYGLPHFDKSKDSGSPPGPPVPDKGPPGGNPRPPFKPDANDPGNPKRPSSTRPGSKAVRSGEGPGSPPGGVGLLRSGLSVPNEPPPSYANESPQSVPNEPPPSYANESPQSVPNEPPPSYANESPQSVPNEPPPSVPNEPPPSYANESPQSVPNEPPPSYANESPQSVPNEPPPSVPKKPPLVPPSYGPPHTQFYDSPASFSNGPPLGLSNEPPQGPGRQSYEAPQSQPFGLPPSQPNERPPGPPSWPTEQPATSYGKIIRFGSADKKFRTEGELKQYYREMYREKHDGINDKYDNLYK